MSALTKRSEFAIAEIKEEIVPINEQFLQLHANYVKMFNILANNVRRVEGRAITHSLTHEKTLAELRKVLSEFYSERIDIDGTRVAFRTQIAALIAVTSDVDLQNYVISIAAYFINDEDHIASKQMNYIRSRRELVIVGGETRRSIRHLVHL
jgi:hypothetical protein